MERSKGYVAGTHNDSTAGNEPDESCDEQRQRKRQSEGRQRIGKRATDRAGGWRRTQHSDEGRKEREAYAFGQACGNRQQRGGQLRARRYRT
jgi:hypothetical protein